jgi:hypothetical protein
MAARARDKRERTVPIGSLSIAATSRYFRSSTAQRNRIWRCSSASSQNARRTDASSPA